VMGYALANMKEPLPR